MAHQMPKDVYAQLAAHGIHVLAGRARLYAALSQGLEVCIGFDDDQNHIYVKMDGKKVVVRREPENNIVIVTSPVKHGPHGDLADCLCNECTAGIGDGP